MSIDPVLVLCGYLEAGDAQDFDELGRWLHPEVTVHSAGGTVSHGVDAQRKIWASAHAGLHDLSHDLLETVTSGNLVAARVVASGVHHGTFLGIAPTGRTVRVDQALFARLENGQIIELWEIVDTGAGLRQLGLLEGQDFSFNEAEAT